MNKIYKLIFIGLVFSFSFLNSASAADGVDILFAQNCQNNNGDCDFFVASGDYLVSADELRKGDRINIDLIINNPQATDVNSVSAWLKYDNQALKAVSIDDSNSDFDLSAPDGNKINENDALVQIGRAKMGGALNTETIYVVSVIFEVLTNENSKSDISFFNYQDSELGDTGVFATTGVLTENILLAEPKQLRLFLNQDYELTDDDAQASNGSSDYFDSDQQIEKEVPILKETPTQIVYPLSEDIARPSGLRVQSGQSTATFVWDFDPNVSGYFVYYSTQSGVYIFRKDVSQTNQATISNLQDGEKYYFAITAYDNEMNESDFSDEVYATVGLSGSESHPFGNMDYTSGEDLIDPLKGRTEDTGAKHVAVLALTLSISILLLRKTFIFLKK